MAANPDAAGRPAAAVSFSSIPVQTATLTRLRTYTEGGRSYDQILNSLMDHLPPDAWIREHHRRLEQEERTAWADAREFLLRGT